MSESYRREEVEYLVLSSEFLKAFKEEAIGIAKIYYNLINICDEELNFEHNNIAIYCKYEKKNSILLFKLKNEMVDMLSKNQTDKLLSIRIDYPENKILSDFIYNEIRNYKYQ
ncbi:MAG: hypothetical protein K0R00_2694 [Herbinix sp.]|jgi:hypothetical protein|nr:hypothetical protein [Herbinix sp.]